MQSAAVVGVSFLCLHQQPTGDDSKFKTYLHKLKHQYLSVGGFGTRTGFKVKRGNETHNLRGFICAECGHVEHPELMEKSDKTNDGWINRVNGEPWLTDREWCDLLSTKNRY